MYGKGNYIPPVRAIYWSMRVMAYAGSAVALVAILAAVLMWRRKLERNTLVSLGRGRNGFPSVRRPTAGWCLTEIGRQPWIVQGLFKTSSANSPSVSTTWLGISLGVFITLYVLLLSWTSG